MLQPDRHGINYYIDPLEEQRLEKLKVRKRRFTRAMARFTIVTTALLGVYAADAIHGERVQAEAEADFSFLSAPLDPSNDKSAIFLFNGFNKEDSDDIGAAYGEIAQEFVDGEVVLVDYDKAKLTPEGMGNQIIDIANANDYTQVSVVGYSAGGGIGLQTMEYIADNSTLRTPLFFAISSPAGIDTLRPYQQKEMANAAFIADIPGASHSTFVRFAAEMYFRRDRYDEGDLGQRAKDLYETTTSALEDLSNDKLTPTSLLIDQIIAIANANFDERLMNISEATESRQKPVILYFGTAKPGRDYIVDNADASKEICEAAAAADLQCFIYNVPGAVHSLPAKAHDAYVETTENAAPDVRAAISKEAILDALKNYTIKTPIFK